MYGTYLPLAVDVAWMQRLVITDEEIRKYGCDMSFVGSLYSNNMYTYEQQLNKIISILFPAP